MAPVGSVECVCVCVCVFVVCVYLRGSRGDGGTQEPRSLVDHHRPNVGKQKRYMIWFDKINTSKKRTKQNKTKKIEKRKRSGPADDGVGAEEGEASG